jgi:hypothetical protein
MHLNNPLNNKRYDKDSNNELGNFLKTLTDRLETEGLGNRTGLLEDVLRESAGEIPFYYTLEGEAGIPLYYTQEEVEAMALCSFILKLPPEERKDLERLEKLFDERQMTGAIRLLFGYLPEDAALRQEASETVLTFLSRNPLGLNNLWHDSRLAAYCLLQGNPKITRDQILKGASKVKVFGAGIGIITPKSACKELIVCPLVWSTGIILILNYEEVAQAAIGVHFDRDQLVIADPAASDEDRRFYSDERSRMLDQGGDAVMGTLSCEDIISVLRALPSAGCDGPPTSVRIHIASPKIDSDIAAAQRICRALLESDPLSYVSGASITLTLYEVSRSNPDFIFVSISEGIRFTKIR